MDKPRSSGGEGARERKLSERQTSRLSRFIHTHPFIIFCGVIVILVLFGLAFMSYRYGAYYLNSDLSSEMVLSKYLADQNAVLTTGWYYSTELRVLYIQLVLIPLFKLFHDWTFIRACAVLITNAILCGGYIFMMRQTKIRGNWIAFSTLFFLLPVSWTSFSLISYGMFYVFNVAFLFFYLGLSVKLDRKKAAKGPGYFVLLTLYCILAVLGGLCGVRYLIMVVAPLALTLIYDTFSHNRRQRETLPMSAGHASGSHVILRFIQQHSAILCGLVLMMVGVAVNNFYLLKVYHVGGVPLQTENPGDNITTILPQTISLILSFLGYTPGVSLFSFSGIHNLIVIVFGAWLCYAVVKRLIIDLRKKAPGSLQTKLKTDSRRILLFFVISILICVVSMLITNLDDYARYLFLSFIFVVPVLAAFLDNQTTRRRQAVLATVLSVFMLGSCALYFQPIWSHSPLYTNLSNQLECVNFLAANDDTYGYATYWNANNTTELSNGQITLVGIAAIDTSPGAADIAYDKFYPWLTRVDYGRPGYHTGKSFLLLTSDEYAKCEDAPLLSQGTVTYDKDGYVVIVFSSDSQLFGTSQFVRPK